jgi:flagellar L-ring protein FlgH
MKKRTISMMLAAAALAACAAVPAAGQDLRDNSRRSLFSDQKASRVGETVTILVVETTVASNDASTSAQRSDDLNFGATANTGATGGTNVGVTLGTGSAFRGGGSTSTKGSVRAKITANVDSVLANGNLVINGSRRIVINQEEQTIKISGVVRPSDIQADNSVYSYNISDATILMEGSGMVEKVQGPGLITKFLHILF